MLTGPRRGRIYSRSAYAHRARSSSGTERSAFSRVLVRAQSHLQTVAMPRSRPSRTLTTTRCLLEAGRSRMAALTPSAICRSELWRCGPEGPSSASRVGGTAVGGNERRPFRALWRKWAAGEKFPLVKPAAPLCLDFLMVTRLGAGRPSLRRRGRLGGEREFVRAAEGWVSLGRSA